LNIPKDLYYSKEHEWVKVETDKLLYGKYAEDYQAILTIGITDFAQSELGDIIFIEFPDLGLEVKFGETFGTIEAVKTVSDLYMPTHHSVVLEINDTLNDNPEKVNQDPYGEGWMIRVASTAHLPWGGLMDAKEYKKLIT